MRFFTLLHLHTTRLQGHRICMDAPSLLKPLLFKGKTSLFNYMLRITFLLFFIIFLMGGQSYAQSTFNWNGGGGDDNWTTGGNWGGTAPGNPQAFLNFNGSTRLTPNNNFSANSPGFQIYFKSGAGGVFTLNGNSIKFFDYSSNAPNIQNEGTTYTHVINFPVIHANINEGNVMNINANNSTSGGPITFTNTLSGGLNGTTGGIRIFKISTGNGTGTITFNGVISDGVNSPVTSVQLQQVGTSNTTILAAANTYSGGTILSAGQLNLNSISAIGSGTFTITGGTIDNTSGSAITLSTYNNAQLWNGDFTFAGTQNLNLGTGTVALNANRTITVSNNTLTEGGIISGGFGITKAGNGMLVLSGANSYTGATTISAGTLQTGVATAIPVTSAVTVNGTLDINGFSPTIGSLAGSGTVTSTSSGNLTITAGGNNSGTNFSGVIQNGSATTIGFTKTGTGTQILSGVNTYTGTTIISSGSTVQLGATDAIPAVPAAGNVILNGGTLNCGSGVGYSDGAGTNTMGLLQVNATSQITLGTGNTLKFAASNSTWAGTLYIYGWGTTPANPGTLGRIFIGSDNSGLSPAQLNQITFNGFAAGAVLLTNGELVPAAVPTLDLPTVTNITNISAVLGARIVTDNSSAITDYGTVYKTTTGVAITDNLLSAFVSTPGSYPFIFTPQTRGTGTVPDPLLNPQTNYFFKGYATNNNGSGLSSEGNFYTLSNPPTTQALSLATASPTLTGFSYTWTAAVFPPTAGASVQGYILLASTGTPSLTNGNGAAPVAASGTIIVSATIAGGATSFTSSGSLSPGTTYNFVLIPFTWNGTNAATYNYLISAAPTATGLTATVPVLNNFTSITANGVYTGETIVLNGINLSGATAISFGATAGTIVATTSTTITATVALGTNANGNITVTIPNGPLTIAFNYLGYRTANAGNWNTPGTWLGNILPTTASRAVTIAHAVNITTDLSGTQTGSFNILVTTGSIVFGSSGYLKVQSGFAFTNNGTVDMSSGGTLEFAGGANFTNNNIFTATAGIVIFSGAATINGSSAITFNNITANGTVTLNTAPTIDGTLLINSSGSVAGSSPTYLCSSTLKYATGIFGQGRGSEWTTATTGAGYPGNVEIGGGTSLNGNASGNNNIALCGTLTIDAGSAMYMNWSGGTSTLTIHGDILINGDLALSSGSGGDLYLYGSWTHAASGSNIDFNSRAVKFIGSGTQIITKIGGGTEDFNGTGGTGIFVINKPSGNVQLNNNYPNATNVLMSGTSVNMFEISNTGGLDLNGQTFTLNGIGGNINVENGVEKIISTVKEGVFFIADNGSHDPSTVYKTVTSSTSNGTLTFGANVKVLITGGIDFGAALTTITDTLEYDSYGHTNGNSPFYTSASTLVYNTATYNRHLEWNSATSGAAGYPANILIGKDVNTILNLYNSIGLPIVNTSMGCSGNLTISAGSSFIVDPMPAGSNLYIGGNLAINGSLILSTNIGSDLYVAGNWTRPSGGSWTSNNRAVFFNGGTDGIITASGGETFPYALLTKSLISAKVTLADSVAITKELTLSEGSLDLANKNLTIVSTRYNTACIDPTTTPSNLLLPYSGTGRFVAQRFFAAHRSWRLITAPLNGDGIPTIKQAWQEGVTNTANTIPGIVNPTPFHGTLITGPYSGTTGYTYGFDPGTQPNSSIYYYNNSKVWAVPGNTAATNVNAYPGWLLFVRGNRNYIIGTQYTPADTTTLDPRGKINVGTQAVAVTTTGYNVIGNPFASEISLDNLFTDPTYYSTIGSNYVSWDPLITGTLDIGAFYTTTYVGGVPSSTTHISPFIDGRIESSAAFLVNFANTTTTLPIREADKRTGSVLVFRPVGNVPVKNFRADLYAINSDSSASLEDGTLTFFDDQFSDSVYLLEDAQKLHNIAENLSLQRSGEFLSIEKRKSIVVTDTIFLNVDNMRQQSYQFVFAADQLDQPNLTAHLEDTYNGTSTPVSLTDTTKINFTVTTVAASQGANRFRIVFQTAGAGPLPVTFTGIKASQQNGNNILVQWNVEDQLNIKEYEMERSTDGKNFVAIGTVKAIGNNQSNETYTWIDADGKNGDNFYRIKSIGTNGTLQYSAIAKVFIGNIEPGIAIYPNPVVNGIVNVQLNNMPKGTYKFSIINNSGQTIAINEVAHNGGSAVKIITINNYLAGEIYNLEIVNPDKSKTITPFFISDKK